VLHIVIIIVYIEGTEEKIFVLEVVLSAFFKVRYDKILYLKFK